MEFHCKTKEFRRRQDICLKIAGDPHASEARWLPACLSLQTNEPILRSLARAVGEGGTKKKLGKIISGLFHCSVLSLGQIFMMAAVACSCGSIAAVFFGQSYERVMYHCGPQDTYTGVFAMLAVPLFWGGWSLYRRKYLKLALLLTVVPVSAFLLATALSGIQSILLAVVSLALLASFLYSGSYLASWKGSWPRQFRPTLWLSIFYLSAIGMLIYELTELVRSSSFEHMGISSVLYTVASVAVFALLPAFLTAVTAGTRRLASGFGLAVIGQLPLLSLALIYSLANAIMLTVVAVLGPDAIADYFSRNLPGGITPDFDLASSNMAELTAKFVSSLIIWLALLASTWTGSVLGVKWNRRKAAGSFAET